MRSFLAAFILSVFSLNASAAIIGMLSESDTTKLELVSSNNGTVKIAVTANYDLPVLYLSRFLGGEGGNVADFIAALSQGKMPEGPKVADWMAPDTDRVSLKVGVFQSNEKHSFVSLFTGQQTNLEMATSSRISIEVLADGSKKQVFEFSVADFAGSNSQKLLNGEIDLALVTQSRAPGAYDSAMKKSVELNFTKQGSAISCNKALN